MTFESSATKKWFIRGILRCFTNFIFSEIQLLHFNNLKIMMNRSIEKTLKEKQFLRVTIPMIKLIEITFIAIRDPSTFPPGSKSTLVCQFGRTAYAIVHGSLIVFLANSIASAVKMKKGSFEHRRRRPSPAIIAMAQVLGHNIFRTNYMWPVWLL